MAPNTTTKRAAIAVVDHRIARVYSAGPTQGKALDLAEVDTLANGHENEHERTRPDMMPGPGKRSGPAGSGVVGAPHMVNDDTAEAEEDRRFAREVAQWLTARPERTEGDRLRVFASKRFLGILRNELDGPNASHVELKNGEFAQMPESELRTHTAIREALPLD